MKENTEAFQLELKTRVSELEGLIEKVDISEANENIFKTIIEIAAEIGCVTWKNHNCKIAEKTKKLIKRRRDMTIFKY